MIAVFNKYPFRNATISIGISLLVSSCDYNIIKKYIEDYNYKSILLLLLVVIVLVIVRAVVVATLRTETNFGPPALGVG